MQAKGSVALVVTHLTQWVVSPVSLRAAPSSTKRASEPASTTVGEMTLGGFSASAEPVPGGAAGVVVAVLPASALFLLHAGVSATSMATAAAAPHRVFW